MEDKENQLEFAESKISFGQSMSEQLVQLQSDFKSLTTEHELLKEEKQKAVEQLKEKEDLAIEQGNEINSLKERVEELTCNFELSKLELEATQSEAERLKVNFEELKDSLTVTTEEKVKHVKEESEHEMESMQKDYDKVSEALKATQERLASVYEKKANIEKETTLTIANLRMDIHSLQSENEQLKVKSYIFKTTMVGLKYILV